MRGKRVGLLGGLFVLMFFVNAPCFGKDLLADLVDPALVIKQTIKTKHDREIRVFLKEQLFAFYQKGELVFWGRICSGMKGFKTPKGKFQVIEKRVDYFSHQYQCPMPYALRFFKGRFLHEGKIQSSPSSHGCVRLSKTNAKRIFKLARVNDPVIIE